MEVRFRLEFEHRVVEPCDAFKPVSKIYFVLTNRWVVVSVEENFLLIPRFGPMTYPPNDLLSAYDTDYITEYSENWLY